MINDNLLTNLAKGLNSESFLVPSFLARGTDVITVSATATELDGEIGDRDTLSGSREDNIVTFNGLISGANVQDTANGDNLKGLALLTAVTDGELHIELSLPGLLQTTAFDIDTDWVLTVDRR